MTTREDLIYRQVFTLKDGARVLVRPLVHEDRQMLMELFLPIGSDDKRYIRHDVNDPKVINQWIDGLDYDKVFPLVAEVNHRVVGVSSLHFREGAARHRAEVRIYLSKEYRQRGVGSRMLAGLIEVAKRRGLFFMEVEIVSDQSHMIKAFHNLGFETRCVLEDFFMLPDGEVRDVHWLILRLHSSDKEF
jgi:L-amino acid N-acyltransferase YncA